MKVVAVLQRSVTYEAMLAPAELQRSSKSQSRAFFRRRLERCLDTVGEVETMKAGTLAPSYTLGSRLRSVNDHGNEGGYWRMATGNAPNVQQHQQVSSDGCGNGSAPTSSGVSISDPKECNMRFLMLSYAII